MVINIGVALIATIVLLTVGARLLDGVITSMFLQIGLIGVMCAALVAINFISLPVGIVLVLVPVKIRAFAYLWFWYLGNKVLDGSFGEEAQWAAELVEDNDTEFRKASKQLNKMEMREIGIVADSKEELRELVIKQSKGDE